MKSKIKIIGYSERGLMNALVYSCDPIAGQGHLLGETLEFLGVIPHGEFTKINRGHPRTGITIYPEYSLSESGTTDILIQISHQQKRRSLVFIEGKVGEEKLPKEMAIYRDIEAGAKVKNTASNLFVQLQRKMQLITTFKGKSRSNNPLVQQLSKEVQRTIALAFKRTGEASFYFIGITPEASKNDLKNALDLLNSIKTNYFSNNNLVAHTMVTTWRDLARLKKRSNLFKTVFNQERAKILLPKR